MMHHMFFRGHFIFLCWLRLDSGYLLLCSLRNILLLF
jgi:hypothetical protein